MANITISNVCNLKCPYCFASSHMDAARSNGSAFIDLETFEKRLDFLDRSGIEQIRLIGGEPTLHPHFAELIQIAQQRHKKLLIFSHGLMPERALRCLASLPPEMCLVLINMNATKAAEGPDEQEVMKRETAVRRLGPRALPGFNIYQPIFQLEPIIDLIRSTGCQPTIRLGLAQPIPAGSNAYLHPKHYPLVGSRLVHYAQLAARWGIKLEFDCGFVHCMFSDEGLAVLQDTGTDIGWRCNPILDLGIDGNAIHCFPLTGQWQIPVTNGVAAADLRQQFGRHTAPYRAAGIYKECSTCRHKQAGSCSGGCLAGTIRRFRHHDIHIVVPGHP